MKFDFCVACYLHFMSIRFMHVLHIMLPIYPSTITQPHHFAVSQHHFDFSANLLFFFKPSCMTLSFNFVAKLPSNARLTISHGTCHGVAQHPLTVTAYIVRLTPNLRKKITFPIPSLHRQMPDFLLTAWSLSLFLSYFAKFHRRYLSLRMIQWLQSTRQRHENDTFIV